ncbi:MAG: DeoR/GlpR family DNA-binding transcription regulator [Lachnospiraceae bacterium]|nr:DeoR/GlpR family DNA-binding transcription regulator [Lachnospiraceae bacterium]
MEKVIAAERQKEILRLLDMQGSVKINSLAKHFQVSRETIRRDLIFLNEQGLIQRSHGGATSIYEFSNIPTEDRINKSADIKAKLCEKAFEYIPENEVIFLDAGSTITHLAKLLATKSNYTIVTASLSVANVLANSNNTIIITGGQLNSSNMSVEGFQTTNFIDHLKVSVSFLGTNGFERHNGPAVTDFSDAQVKSSIIPNSKCNIVISDSSKAFSSALVQYANWSDIDYLITDNQIPESVLAQIQKSTEVILLDLP